MANYYFIIWSVREELYFIPKSKLPSQLLTACKTPINLVFKQKIYKKPVIWIDSTDECELKWDAIAHKYHYAPYRYSWIVWFPYSANAFPSKIIAQSQKIPPRSRVS